MTIRLLCCSGSLEGGGSERQLWQLATGIDQSRFCPQIYLLYRRGKYLKQVPSELVVHDFWSSRHSLADYLPGAIHARQVRHLRNCLCQQSVNVVYDRTFHMTLITAPACQAVNCPRVSVIVSPPSHDFQRSRERFRFVKKRLLRRAYRDPLAKVLAVSESVAEDACQFYGLCRADIEVVPSPVDVDLILRESSSAVSLRTTTRRVCVVGRMSQEKGQALAIQAFAQATRLLDDDLMHLDLIGDGPCKPTLVKLTHRMGIDDQVTFHGFQDNPYPFIAAADLLLIPSEYEGLPNVALESMVLRTPVLATDCSPSLSVLLGKGSRGQQVPNRNVTAMAEAMVSFFEHPDDWPTRLEQAHRYVLERHALEPWLRRMEQILAEHASRARTAVRSAVDS